MHGVHKNWPTVQCVVFEKNEKQALLKMWTSLQEFCFKNMFTWIYAQNKLGIYWNIISCVVEWLTKSVLTEMFIWTFVSTMIMDCIYLPPCLTPTFLDMHGWISYDV